MKRALPRENVPHKRRRFSSELPHGYSRSYLLSCGPDEVDFSHQVSFVGEDLKRILRAEVEDHHHVSFIICLDITFIKDTTGESSTGFGIHTKRMSIQTEEDIEPAVASFILQALNIIETVELRGSGWIFKNINKGTLHVSTFRPFTGASSFFPLPPKLRNKRACINVQNRDEKCFLWSILSALHPPSHHVDRVSKYSPFQHELNMEGLPMPMPVNKSMYLKFLELNPHIHLNVFLYEEEEVVPFFQDPKDPQHAINLLFIQGPQGQGHYCWIKNFSALVFGATKHHHQLLICFRCFGVFNTQSRLDQHLPDCHLLTDPDGMKKIIPHCKECPQFDSDCEECREKVKISFSNFSAQLPTPFYFVCDFESTLTPVPEKKEDEEQDTEYLAKHCPLSFAAKLVFHPEYVNLPFFQHFANKDFIMESVNTGNTKSSQQLMEVFLSKIMELGRKLMDILTKTNVPMQETEESKRIFRESQKCGLCGHDFEEDGFDVKVRHHDHLTGKFICAAHQDCNVNCHYRYFKIPVIFHNLKGYDSKHIITGLSQLDPNSFSNLDVLAANAEQIKSITLGPLRFLDSLQHLPSSLDGLVKALLSDCQENGEFNVQRARDKFGHLSSRFGHFPDQEFALLLRKGVFPYAWMDCPEKLNETALPPKEDFFNDLEQEDISESDYSHAQAVWNTFHMKTFQDYHDLYLETDVLLLVDVLENYREISRESYNLDPLWFLTAPALTFSAALRKTKATLAILTDIDMFNFFQKGIRGGLSYVAKRRSIANVPAMSSFKPDKPEKHLLYLDANNLYGASQMAPLPFGGFRWITPEDFNRKLEHLLRGASTFEEELKLVEESHINFVLEVDAEFPKEIHDKMKDFPFLPENISPKDGSHPKLINHLGPRNRYPISLEMFLLARQEGVVFPKIHRVLQFQQSRWLAPYIQLNTDLRTTAKDSFRQDYYKLLNNR